MGKGHYLRWNTKASTSSHKKIDIVDLKSWGLLGRNKTGELHWTRSDNRISSVSFIITTDKLSLRYVDKDQTVFNESFSIVTTDCNYGGKRYWFICPECSRKIRILYDGSHFMCRKCHNLRYPSENENKNDRAARRISAIQKVLAPHAELCTFDGASYLPKPKWMKLVRYEKLIEEAKKQELIFKVTAIEMFGFEASQFFE